ncbi:MAG TPA: SDR family oxidoreductase [Candidatus Angelobacter sp.]|jgi:NAD(P)-dependent dehydrogenase (short-subunit alcohol dehydrogenase family)|nr:SDR family oxidoreductase [Candidatus Angelobacter sp.]
MPKLSGRVIAITGGCGDIGMATARVFCQEGATVVLLDVDPPRSSLGKKARGASNTLSYLPCDVRDRASVEAVFDRILRQHERLDVAIANAGVVANEPFLEITDENWKATLDVNLTGAFHTAQAAARIMAKQKPGKNGIRGKVLFTGSWVQEMPWPEGTSYIVSKSGIKMMAKTMAQELAKLKILVNVLAPGIVMAGLSKKIYEANPTFRRRVGLAIPLGEMQTVESVAQGFLFLASDDSNYMTGATLLMDGGNSLVRRD